MNFTDLNAHIIPNIDPQINDFSHSLEILKKISSLGVETIVATPNNLFVENNSRSEIQDVIDQLNASLTEIGVNNINLLLGMENNLDNYLPQLFTKKLALTINDTEYATIKFPFLGLPQKFPDTLNRLHLMGITPILMNIENNSYIQKNPNQIRELIEENCLIQLSSASLLGLSGILVKNLSAYMISNNYVHIVSDFINYDLSVIERNLHEITDLLEASCGEKTMQALININPKLVAFGNAPHLELEEIRPSQIKIFFRKPLSKIPSSIELIQWKFFDFIKIVQKIQNKITKKFRSRST